MAGYVIEYSRRTHARRVTEFATPQDAIEYRLKLDAVRNDTDIEIVALGSKSLATLMETHSRYFTGEDLAAVNCVLH